MATTLLIDKDLVRKRFASAISYYDEEASPQRMVSDRIAALLEEKTEVPSGRIFEIGCGTGFLSRHLWEKFGDSHQLLFNDLCPDMEAPLREKVGDKAEFSAFDAETTDWQEDFALIAAASCIQWWQHPTSFYSKSYRHLTEGGILAFGTYGQDNLHQLKEVTGKGLNYDSAETVRHRLELAGYDEIHVEEMRHTLYFPDFLSVLRHLKLTGVNAVSSSTTWTSAKISAADAHYRDLTHTSDGTLPLTYHAIIGIARK
ncbi:malonyl-ACP O-methyltransferase BioC [Porphyromonas sp.]|uniref:malonyl-ACP O-methyltransferase BioC n=1 Tax=Porphyromonas sp. TaxID=1924944 RepID=UPI0026DAD9F3|nr:malonyl-ACP O-methyltransferase BioC [Porphyromonas sp.]MDO4771583.1 malonyl-ACP O-methyltransferase BioC [Porphyromonas sp.]